MKQLISEFNSEYRNYSAIGYNNYQFTEDDNKGKPDTLQSLTILGIDACVIPKSIIKDSTSIYAKANSQDILRKDNDGIFLKEENGKKYIYLCELKSSFLEGNIIKAKDQIVGAYIKLHSLFSALQSYNPSEWSIRGIIASYSPSIEKISDLQRKMENGDIKTRFCFNLQRDKKYIMPEANCKRSFFPLHVPEITIYHISVPDKTENYTIDFNDII
ncbi:hypothetical protein I6E11_08880 [Bacteroides caecigallinarum]|uniref:hypothetical protein n=1 Tax=Bacteroides caecigallinarum TaxID=1411144 RepID=UPI001F3BFD10|nr:hypothetical protein [Bacteroides caecigallinarum]MCF2593892.1 hypothetical protein [Bacteroides caecigallinarum]